MKVAIGPLLIDTEDRFEKNQVHVGVERETWADPNFSDFAACVAALPLALRLPASEIVIERKGNRSRVYSVRAVQEEMRRHPERTVGCSGLGNIDDPHYGLNIAPGHHVLRGSLSAQSPGIVTTTAD